MAKDRTLTDKARPSKEVKNSQFGSCPCLDNPVRIKKIGLGFLVLVSEGCQPGYIRAGLGFLTCVCRRGANPVIILCSDRTFYPPDETLNVISVSEKTYLIGSSVLLVSTSEIA